MALGRSASMDRRLEQLAAENSELVGDVERLEDALLLHSDIVSKDDQSVRGMIRKEVGGSRWQYGGEGKLWKFRGTGDIENDIPSSQLPSKATRKSPGKPGADAKKKPATEREDDIAATLNIDKITSGYKRNILNKMCEHVKEIQDPKPFIEQNPASSEDQYCFDELISEKNLPVSSDNVVPIKVKVTRKSNKAHPGSRPQPYLQPQSRRLKTKLRQTGEKVTLKSTQSNVGSKLAEAKADGGDSGLETESQKLTVADCDPDVAIWLFSLKLKDAEKYVLMFAEHEIDMDNLKLLTEKQLKDMGVTTIGPLNKILQALRNIRGESYEAYLGQVAAGKNLSVQGIRGVGSTKQPEQNRPKTERSSRSVERQRKTDNLDHIPVKDVKTGRPNSSRRPLSANKSTSGGSVDTGILHRKKDSTRPRGPLSQPMSKGVALKERPKSAKVLTKKLNKAVNDDVQTSANSQKTNETAEEFSEKDLLKKLKSQLDSLERTAPLTDTGSLDVISQLRKQLESLRTQAKAPGETSVGLEKPAVKPVVPALDLSPSKGKNKSPKPPVLVSMSKLELVSEVRKQKQEYSKQIRHLESELTRLKHADPLRTCELPAEDIYFNETELIGQGTFSQVFKGTFQGSDVAVKRLRVPLTSQDKNYFAAEVSLLRELRHPRVVLLLGVTTSCQLPVMVLEYMGQGSLYQVLHDPEQPAFDHVAYYLIARDTALGMNYLHRHRPPVLHLDLKSMNVLISSHGRAKIGDFGFSKLRHDAELSKKGGIKGTPAWMAPEMLSGGEISVKADVYSFGIIQWEMFTRRHPYEGLSTYQVIERVRKKERPELPISCPVALAALIKRCWDSNPAARPSFKDILMHLEDLAFPREWRTLLAAADIPKAALDNIVSAREIIGFVSSLADGCSEDQDVDIPVPSLDLHLEDVTDLDFEDSSESDVLPWEQSDETPPIHSPETVSTSSVPVPPPPPLPVPPVVKEIVPPVASESTNKSQPVMVTNEDLIAQRGNLKKTISGPHPNQLTDLKKIPQDRLTSIAEVLKQAVQARRPAISGGSEDIPEGSQWSTLDD